mmetsp:Transcript_10073/g.23552  ORF Transcript_10073/g.23552 Transcript_10073/m.23552 type:complete len:139 (-) Transcript_10073:140-556(-)
MKFAALALSALAFATANAKKTSLRGGGYSSEELAQEARVTAENPRHHQARGAGGGGRSRSISGNSRWHRGQREGGGGIGATKCCYNPTGPNHFNVPRERPCEFGRCSTSPRSEEEEAQFEIPQAVEEEQEELVVISRK